MANSFQNSISTDVRVTFDEAIVPATATAETLVVQSDHGGRLAAADATLSVEGTTISLEPNRNFFPGDVVHVTATAGIQGSSAAVPRVWQFRTASSGSGVFADSGQDLGSSGTQFVKFGDADGDGDVDAKEGGSGPLWLNDGSGVFSESGQTFNPGGELEFGDVDGDGDNDIVGTGSVWINNGSGVFSNSQSLSGGGSVELGDVDGDGDLDILKAGPGYGGDEVWLNNGNGSFTNTGQVLGTGSTQATEAADFDGDGDLDFFAVINGGANLTFLNDGTGIFTSSQSLGGAGSSIDLDLGDLDGDGDVDAIVANNPQTSNGSHVFINDGNGIFAQSPQNLGPSENNWGIELGDLDGDGDLDAFVANLGNPPISIWLNDGSATFTDSGQTLATPTGPYGVDIADVDGDGDLDAWIAVNSRPSRLWINQNLNPNVSLSVDTAVIAEESGTATITAALDAAFTQDVTIELTTSGTATATDDYTLSGNQIVIAAGETSGSVTVTAVSDDLDEADESVTIGLGSITNGQAGTTSQVTVTITDDDPEPTLVVAVDSGSIAEEAGAATLTATLSAISGRDVTVDLAVTGSATPNVDYTLSASQILIPAGSMTGSATVTAIQDPVDEPNETIEIDVTAVVGAAEEGEQGATITIVDDDAAPTVTLSVDSASIAENGGVANFTATMSAPSTSEVTIDLAITGSATASTDYNLSATQIVIAAGDTSGSIRVTALADIDITEGPETIIVDIDTVTNATEDGVQQATTTIIDDVNGPDVTLSVDSNSVAEAGGTATVTATLANAFSLPVTIELGFSGSATEGTDYGASATQIVVAAGETSGSITITGIDDGLIEGDETVIVDVTSVINGNEVDEQQVVVTLTDDESPPTVTLAADSTAIAEAGGVSTLTVSLSSATTLPVTVDLAVTGTASAADYNLSSTQIVIAAGATSGTAVITAVDDSADDDDETIVVDISNVTNATESGEQQATITILDDDDAPPLPPGPFPLSNATAASRNTDVAFNFEQDVLAVNDQTFTLHGSRSGGQITGAATTVSSSGPVAIHSLAEEFAPGELVQATVTSGISLSGGSADPFVWQFRTATGGSGQFEDGGVFFGQFPFPHVAVADIDGDGDLDVVRGEQQVWLNDGSANFTNSGQDLGGGLGEFVFADVDGDGDLDIAGGRIMLNDGSGTFSNSGSSPGGSQTRVGDLDGDGDLDLMTGVRYGANRVWFNDGNGGFSDSGQTLGGGSTDAIELGDFDNDGDLDAFEALNGTANKIWINDGDGGFSETQEIGGFRATKDADVGDVDGDGDLDIVTGNVYSNNGAHVYLNTGDGVFIDSGQVIGGATGQLYRVRVGDMDGDGDLDVVAFQRVNGGTEIWLNDGSGTFIDSGQRLMFANNANRRIDFAELGDVDGDGDLDLIEANVRGVGPGSRIWFNQNLEPSVSLSVDTESIPEAGGVATVTANLSQAHTVPVTIELSLSGAATSGTDYVASATQIVVPAGELNGSITITATDDTTDEPDEAVVVGIESVGNGQGSGQVTVTIVDDDEAVIPAVSLEVDSPSIVEDGGVATFTATLSESTSVDVTVDLAISGTASSADYVLSATQIVIVAGSVSGSITVTAVDDTESESSETVRVSIEGVVNGTESGEQEATTTIVDNDAPPSLRVNALTATSTGFVAEFNGDLNADVLNLYDAAATDRGPADVVLTGATVGEVDGSLVLAGRTVTFIRSGAPLAPDSYSVTLRSGADAFSSGTMLLDGDGDGVGGDDYLGNFTVAEPAADTVTVSIPDFVRGPGQAVEVPAQSDGLPLTVNDGAGIRSVIVAIAYDPSLLSITDAEVAAGVPAGASVALDLSIPGNAVVTFTSPTDLGDGEVTFVHLAANVPTADAAENYGLAQVIDLHSISVMDSAQAVLPTIDDDSLHVVEYFADVSGNRRVNAADAAQVARVAALLDDGFASSPNHDPTVIGDISGNGRINAADASLVAQVAALLPVDQVPPIPSGVFTAAAGGLPPAPVLPQGGGGNEQPRASAGTASDAGSDDAASYGLSTDGFGAEEEAGYIDRQLLESLFEEDAIEELLVDERGGLTESEISQIG